jgi:uncharacterized protein
MTRRRRIVAAVACGGIVAAAAGCSILAPRPDLTRYYVLTPAADPAVEKPRTSTLVVGLGPVTLPAYLDRPQMVTRVDENRISIADADRWAEPLDGAFARVLGQDIAASAGVQVVSRFPWPPGSAVVYQIEIEVARFESRADGSAELAARWSLRDVRTKALMLARDFGVERQAASKERPAMVASLSECVAALGAEIAGVVGGLGA